MAPADALMARGQGLMPRGDAREALRLPVRSERGEFEIAFGAPQEGHEGF